MRACARSAKFRDDTEKGSEKEKEKGKEIPLSEEKVENIVIKCRNLAVLF